LSFSEHVRKQIPRVILLQSIPVNKVSSISTWFYVTLQLTCMKEQLSRLRKLWECFSLNISMMQYSHSWSYLGTLPDDIHIHALKTHLSIKYQRW